MKKKVEGPGSRGRAYRRTRTIALVFLGIFGLQVFGLSGCAPTYPKEKLEESIVKLCKDEYKLDVKAKVIGTTMAIYLPLTDLLDFTFTISKPASEKINDVILGVSRVLISTDANIKFYCIIAHDVRIPEVQIVIVKAVYDVKRLLLNDISRGEYSKRILIDLRLNPQAQKERAIRDVFQRMGLDSKWQETVMNDFFRAEPAGLGDIGYWNDRFYVKDVSLEEFLAEQIANRLKIEFKDNKDLGTGFILKAAKGSYIPGPPRRYFKLEILAEPRWLKDFGSPEMAKRLFASALGVAAETVHGYTFDNFDFIEVTNQSGGQSVRVQRGDLEKYRPKNKRLAGEMDLEM